jgi:hypothetical protein
VLGRDRTRRVVLRVFIVELGHQVIDDAREILEIESAEVFANRNAQPELKILFVKRPVQSFKKVHQLGGQRGINALPIDENSRRSDVLQFIYKLIAERALRVRIASDKALHGVSIPAPSGEVRKNGKDLRSREARAAERTSDPNRPSAGAGCSADGKHFKADA